MGKRNSKNHKHRKIKMSNSNLQALWMSAPKPHTYEAARSFLTLLYKPTTVNKLIAQLRRRDQVELFKAKDIIRASCLTPLTLENAHVAKNAVKIRDGEEMSPPLLVVDPHLGRLIVADGYHRVSACYVVNEDMDVAVRRVVVGAEDR